MAFVEAIPIGNFAQDAWDYPKQLISPNLLIGELSVQNRPEDVDVLYIQFDTEVSIWPSSEKKNTNLIHIQFVD